MFRELKIYLDQTYQSIDEYHQIVDQIFLKKIQNCPKLLILLSGPMGAGKTEFVKKISEHFNYQGVSSPTFAIHQSYVSTNQSLNHRMDHVDLFRLESEEEVESSGFWDLFSSPEGLIVVEWPERVEFSQLPLNWPILKIEISIEQNLQRRIQVFEALIKKQ